MIVSGTNPLPGPAFIVECRVPGHFQPIEILLAQAGQKIVKDELHSEWMRITQITRVIQKYKIRTPLRTHRAKELQPLIVQYFEKHDTLRLGGIKVEYKTERNERYREVPRLRFHKHDPANDGPLVPLPESL
jgi:hypothetical protein